MMRQYELVERVQKYDPKASEALLNRAYVYAMKAHGHQKRASGDPYFSHPLEVAAILTAAQIIDDWDESDRAKVNLIAGQAGISAGAGAVAANTPRVTHASDDPVTVAVQLIDNLVLVEDAAHANGDPGVQMLAVRTASPANRSGTDGDYEPLQLSGGRLWVSAALEPASGTLTDRSGSVTAGGTAQEVAAANSSRKYFFIQNVSDIDLWIDFGATAVADQPSIRLSPGASFEMTSSGGVSTQSVSLIGATTGKKFTAKEM